MFGYAIWKFRVKPGDEGDGEPIHGNTRLEIAWTVIPTIIVLFGAGYSWVVLDDIEAKDAERDAGHRHRPAVQVDLRVPRAMIGSGNSAVPLTTNELHVPGRPPARGQDARARRPALLLGPRVADQARRGPGRVTRRPRASTTTSSSPRTRRAPSASSAPSSAASGTRRCGRPSWSSPRRSSTPGSPSRRRRSRRPAGGAVRGVVRRDIGSEEVGVVAAAIKATRADPGGARLRPRRRPSASASSSRCARSPGSTSSRPSRPATRT